MTGHNQNNTDLVQRAQEDPQEFGALYELYVQRIYNYVYYRTGNVHDAEDLTAQVFIRAMYRLPHYKERGLPFSAWLYRIAHNLVANWHRDRKRRQIVSLTDSTQDETRLTTQPDSPEIAEEKRETAEILLEAIRDLPHDRQQLLILKFVERISNAEIGEIIGRSEGAVKSLYHRTLLALRRELTKNDSE